MNQHVSFTGATIRWITQKNYNLTNLQWLWRLNTLNLKKTHAKKHTQANKENNLHQSDNMCSIFCIFCVFFVFGCVCSSWLFSYFLKKNSACVFFIDNLLCFVFLLCVFWRCSALSFQGHHTFFFRFLSTDNKGQTFCFLVFKIVCFLLVLA